MHVDSITNRGTSTAVHEYAKFLSAQGHELIWSYNKNQLSNDSKAIKYFSNFHNLEGYDNFADYARVKSKELDWAYFLKRGDNDGLLIPGVQNNVHVVFNYYQPHGNQYAYISKWLAEYAGRQANTFVPAKIRHRIPYSKKTLDFVPHCVDMPKANESLRALWNIPDDARVCIRYGGFDTFDITWVKSCVQSLLENQHDYYFVGINTERFTDHPRAIFVPPILDPQEKANALSSADVFLHGRLQGESFGLSIVESIQSGLKTLVWGGGRDLNHLNLVPSSDIYKSSKDLYQKLMQIRRDDHGLYLNSRGNEFKVANVMPKFAKVFNLV